jgi:hypothetical protein
MSRVLTFYDVFEKNVTGLSTDVTNLIRNQVEELLDGFPRLRRETVNLEMECRFKGATSDKILGPLVSDLEATAGYVKTAKEITDINYSLGKVKGFNMTVRDSFVDGRKTVYAKIKLNFPRNSPVEKVLGVFESLGLKFSFSLEIGSQEFCDELLRDGRPAPLKRVKNRITYTDSLSGIAFDITRVFQSNNMRKETELEIDYTTQVESFSKDDPIGRIKNFISTCEEKARTIVYRTRTLIPSVLVENAIVAINKALGSPQPSEWKIEKRIPQVRNLQVKDLLKENYKGYGCTPKADGYRYFLIILKSTIMLVRPPNIYKVLYEGSDIPPGWVGFVFDGELIEQENLKPENLDRGFFEAVDNYYCIFDVVGFPDQENAPQGVLSRINTLKTFFEEVRRGSRLGCFNWSNTYNSIYLQPHPNTRVRTPIKKTFIEIKPYSDATETTWHAADSFFEDQQPRLRYKDDGLIFTPRDSTYEDLTKSDNMTLKWKPLEMLSIDFRYKDGDLYVWSSEKESLEVPFRGTAFYPLTREQIVVVNPEKVRLVNGTIYEFIYETGLRVFRVTRPRFDKAMPNTAKDSSQIWTDYNRPVSQNLVRGLGSDGLIECQREAMWSWVEHFLSRASGPIFDFTNFKPAVELPIRFLENQSFTTLTKNIVVYRLESPFEFDFPQAKRAPSDIANLPEIDIMIINGQQLCMLEGREGIRVGDKGVVNSSYVELLKALVSRSNRIFVRNFASIIPSELPTLFHPDRACYGQEEELEVVRVDDSTLNISFKYGGVFYDISTGSYNTLLNTRAYVRNLTNVAFVSSGHRILNSALEDGGPERILGGKHFGKIFDYLYNAVFPVSYFMPFFQGLFNRVPETFSPIDDIVNKMERLSTRPEPRQDVETEDKTFSFAMAFQTVREETPSKATDITLIRESSKMPVEGDVFVIIAKAMAILEEEIPPGGKTFYDKDVIYKQAAELRLMMGALNVEQLMKTLYELLGIGIIFVRRIRNSNVVVEGYRARFIEPEVFNNPRYGFLIVESRLESLSLLSSCSLLSYRNKFIIHRSDPILELLYSRPLDEVNLTKEKLKISPSNSGKIKVGSINWPSLHRLFNSLRYVYPGAPEINKEFIKVVANETTDNKADYLINMTIPPRFKRQAWAVSLQATIDDFSRRGVLPDPSFDDRAEAEFGRVLEGMTEKSRREILATGESFLYDDTYLGNLYGRGLMTFRSTLTNL